MYGSHEIPNGRALNLMKGTNSEDYVSIEGRICQGLWIWWRANMERPTSLMKGEYSRTLWIKWRRHITSVNRMKGKCGRCYESNEVGIWQGLWIWWKANMASAMNQMKDAYDNACEPEERRICIIKDSNESQMYQSFKWRAEIRRPVCRLGLRCTFHLAKCLNLMSKYSMNSMMIKYVMISWRKLMRVSASWYAKVCVL